MEQAHILNPPTNLVGVSSISADAGHNSDLAIVMFNAGYLHHVGPNRINTSFARILAASGFHSLRFDISGLGDSGANNEVHSNASLVEHDAKCAMDFMQSEFNCSRFVLFGLCSGALDSLHIAQHDKRVVGIVAIDGIGFRTWRFYLHHLLSHIAPRLLLTRHWLRGVSKSLHLFRHQLLRGQGTAQSVADDGSLVNKSRNEVSQILQTLTKAKVKMRFIYTGGVANYYNYGDQFRDMFSQASGNTNITWQYYPQADHLFMLEMHREALLGDVQKWLQQEFG